MVRISPFVVVLAGATSVVQALPAQVISEKRAEAAPNFNAQLTQLTTALQQLADTPTSSNINKNAAYAGAAMVGLVGALIGGAIGAYMPPNTTFTPESIIAGLTTEATQATAAADAFKQDGGLSIITSLIPTLGSLIASQPNLQRGQPSQNGPYIPPPPPMGFPSAPAPKDVPVPPVAAPLAAPAPPADPMAGMDMGAKPASSPPAAPKGVTPAEPKAPNLPVPATPSKPAPFTPSNPAQRGPKPTAAVPSAPVTPPMPGMEMGGHAHSGRRRR